MQAAFGLCLREKCELDMLQNLGIGFGIGRWSVMSAVNIGIISHVIGRYFRVNIVLGTSKPDKILPQFRYLKLWNLMCIQVVDLRKLI